MIWFDYQQNILNLLGSLYSNCSVRMPCNWCSSWRWIPGGWGATIILGLYRLIVVLISTLGCFDDSGWEAHVAIALCVCSAIVVLPEDEYLEAEQPQSSFDCRSDIVLSSLWQLCWGNIIEPVGLYAVWLLLWPPLIFSAQLLDGQLIVWHSFFY